MNATSVGSVVTTAPGLRRLGVLDILTVTNVIVQGNTVAASTATLFGATTGTLYLSGAGTFGTVDVKGNRITSVATCTTFSPGTDAANKAYVDQEVALVGTKGFNISIDITGFNLTTPENEIITWLNYLLPITNTSPDDIFNLVVGTRVRALCLRTTVNIASSPPQYVTIVANEVQVVDTLGATQSVVGYLPSGQIPTSLSFTSTIKRQVKEFKVVNTGTAIAWQFIQNITPEI